MIGLKVLEALLSNDAQRRQMAEAHFQAMDVNARVVEWPAVFHQAAAAADSNINSKMALMHMITVLWRRDILQCEPEKTAVLLDPLCQLFAAPSLAEKIRAALGHCLAEVVALTQSTQALEQALQVTEGMISNSPGPVLHFYEALSQAVPSPQWTPAVTSWIFDRLVNIPAAGTTNISGGFCKASDLTQANQRTVQMVNTLAALARHCTESTILEHLLHKWLTVTTDPDTLALLLQTSNGMMIKDPSNSASIMATQPISFSDTFWQAAWQQVQPHAASEPRLVCETLQGMVDLSSLTPAQSSEAVQLLLEIMARAVDEDITDWTAVEWLEEDSYETDHDEEGLAAYAMDVMQLWLTQYAQLLPVVLNAVQSPDKDSWRSLWTTITAWQVCLSALPVALEPHASSVYSGLSQILSLSTHERVRHQAWQTLAGLVQTYPQYISSDKDGLAKAMGQGLMDGHPRVVAAVCRVLTSVAIIPREDDEEKVWNVGHLEILLQGLTQGPLSAQVACRLVVVRALRAVAALARSAPMGHFYAPTMSLLLQWSEREVSVMGDALEAASLVAQSLIEEEALEDRVRSDAHALVERLVHILQQEQGTADLEPLLSGCARLASVLGDGFAPFLPAVLEYLLAKVIAQDEIELGEGDADGLDQTRRRDWQEDSLTVALPGRGLTKVTLHTSQIEEKAQAIRAIYELASALPSMWAPYLEKTWQALEPLIDYKYHADIRTTAAQSMAALVEAGFQSECDFVWGFPRVALAVAKQLVNEANTEQEDLFALADSISNVLYHAYSEKQSYESILRQTYTSDIATQIVHYCGQSLQKCLQRRASLSVQIVNSESPDEHASCNQQLESERKLMTPLVDSIGYSLKIMGPAFAPIFEQKAVPLLGPFLTPNADTRARWSAICLFDDCVEHCGSEAAARFAPQLLPAVVSGMQDPSDQDLVQCSIYGIAQIARRAPSELLVPYADLIIPALIEIASRPKETVENMSIHENSVSALASLVLFPSAPFRGKHIKLESALKILLENMPLSMDYDEAKVCSAGLCALLASSTSIPLVHYAKDLIRVIGETLALVADDDDVASESACERMTEILINLQRETPSAELNEAFSTLSPESQYALQSAVERHSFLHNNVVTP